MIIGYILDLFYRFLSFIIGLFPTGDLGIPTGFSEGLTLVVSYLHAWSWLLPVDTFLSAAITVTGFYAVLIGVKVFLWVIRTIRGSGS